MLGRNKICWSLLLFKDGSNKWAKDAYNAQHQVSVSFKNRVFYLLSLGSYAMYAILYFYEYASKNT